MTPITADMIEDTQTEPATESLPNGTSAQAGNEAASLNGHEPAESSTVAHDIAARELKAIVEAMLFVSNEPLSVARFVAVLGDVTKAEVEAVLQSLGEDLEQEGRGIRLAEIAGGFRLVTKQEYAAWIKRLDKAKSSAKLSRSALESLAIIAYKQPIVRSEIEEIRGVEASGVVRTLLERKLVRIVGRKEVPGRPIMYGTTKYFLEHFGLSDLSQLPPLREFKELGEAEQSMLPMDGDAERPSEEPLGEESAESSEVLASEFPVSEVAEVHSHGRGETETTEDSAGLRDDTRSAEAAIISRQLEEIAGAAHQDSHTNNADEVSEPVEP